VRQLADERHAGTQRLPAALPDQADPECPLADALTRPALSEDAVPQLHRQGREQADNHEQHTEGDECAVCSAYAAAVAYAATAPCGAGE